MTARTEAEIAPAISAKPIDIEKLIKSSLPSSTNSLIKIRSMLHDINVSGSAISNAVAGHPSLLARILRLANSPVYSAGKAVSSIPAAINAVGTKVLSDIVTIEITSSAFKKILQNSPCAGKIWEHSLAVGFIARRLSEILKMKDGDEAFTCGLLHDLGKMLLLLHDEKRYSAVAAAQSEKEMLALEKQIYGYHHTEIGALIARRWGLPEDICHTILHHHDSSQATECTAIICLIDLSDMIANSKGYGLRQTETSDSPSEEFSNSPSAVLLNLTKAAIDELCAENLDQSLAEITRTFS